MTSSPDMAALIALADGTLGEIRARLGADGPTERIAELAVAEIASRAALEPQPLSPVTVALELTSEHGTALRHLRLGGGLPPAPAPAAGEAQVALRQELAEVLRALFGPEERLQDATRRIAILNEPGPETDDPDDPWLAAQRDATIAAGAVVEALSGAPRRLGALARHFGSDKWDDCDFTVPYTAHFAARRRARLRLLEIGIGGFEAPDRGGESLRMWKHAFPRGLIFGLDVFDKSALAEPRIVPLHGDQSDPGRLREIDDEHGPFDIVIDDGSHISAHVRASFLTLFPWLCDGGLYVIEDLQTSYWPGWNGGHGPGDDAETTMGLVKWLLDALHYQDRLDSEPEDELARIGRAVRAVHVHRNLAVIEKGANLGPTAPSWVRRHENDMDISPKGSMRRSRDGGGCAAPRSAQRGHVR